MSNDSLFNLLCQVENLQVKDDVTSLSKAATDFGGLTRGRVQAIAVPKTVDALVALVRIAQNESLSFIPRSLGLSQSGQSIPIDGISVDMSNFGGIEVNTQQGIAYCGSGVTWRQLMVETVKEGWIPEVMPLNLDLSIGGTLSVGGIGSTSHRYGMSVSAVKSLTVVTGTGKQIETSENQHQDVFESVLGGLGKFGFICQVELRLRSTLSKLRTWFLLYDNLASMLRDECILKSQTWCTHIEGFSSAAVQGLKLKPNQGERVPFARWFYGLQVSEEYESEAALKFPDFLDQLSQPEVLHVQDDTPAAHAARYDLRFQTMKSSGLWQKPHPWFECMLSYDAALQIIPEILADLPLLFGDGHRIMPISNGSLPRFLCKPASSPVILFTIVPTGIESNMLQSALESLRKVHDKVIEAGGKRYLSGWLFEPDEEAWCRHYGSEYEMWLTRKHSLDPYNLFQSCL